MAISALVRRVVAKTAAYSIESRKDRSGTLFTNRGASGSVTFTLPPASRCTGWEYTFLTVAAQAIVVASKTADTLVVYGDATADSLATPAQLGVQIQVRCDGTSWIATGSAQIPGGATGATFTLAT